MNKLIWSVLALFVFTNAASARQKPPQWITDGPYTDGRAIAIEVPMEVLATKLYVEVELGGRPRRFVFDTGSPSMIDVDLAKELGLDVVGKSKGTDAHGVVIESEIVQAELTLGGTTFHKVPMFSADFSKSEATKLLIGNGVLGSEMLPLGAWQIDLPNSVLRCNSDVKKLPLVKNATKLRLYDFGYPHAPIFDVQFAERAKSKALFDTGSPSYFAISPPDLAGARQANGIGKTISGFGSPGGSLGGQAPNGDQLQAELKTLSIGGLALGRVGAVRASSPSLIGAGMLEHFVVTFDSRSGDAYFAKYADGPFARPSFGFTLAFDKQISVALVWDDSPAHAAGLRPGLHLTSINGAPTEFSREGLRRTIESMEGQEIELEWDGGSAKLSRTFGIIQD